jgi:hypothetical protein
VWILRRLFRRRPADEDHQSWQAIQDFEEELGSLIDKARSRGARCAGLASVLRNAAVPFEIVRRNAILRRNAC